MILYIQLLISNLIKSICVCEDKFEHGILCFIVVLNELFMLNVIQLNLCADRSQTTSI